MALQTIGLGSSANDGNGDTLRAAGTKINANTGEIYARFGSGSANGATLETATSGNILVGNGSKFASVTTTGDFDISSTGAINVRADNGASGVHKITIPQGSEPGTTANTLYNIGGALYFNGSVVGSGNVTGMTSFTVAGDFGSLSVTQGDSVTFTGGTGISSAVTASGDNEVVTLNIDSTVATLTGTQTLENKTLTSPSVSGLTLSDASIVLEGATTNDFETTLTVTDPTADRTITFPDATGTVALTSDITVTASSTTAFTNKTIDANGTGNTITNLEVADFTAAAIVTQSDTIASNNNDTTIQTSAAVKAYADSVGGGSSTLAGLSDTTIASSAAGQTLLYDGSDSYDNKQIKVFENNSAYTTAFPMFFGSQMFTVSAADTTNGYTFENFNSDGTDANNGGSGAGQTLYIFEDQVVVFYLNWGGSHPFAIRTGASGGSDGTNLATGNGGDNLIHIAANGTVTTGTSANAQTSGYLIWKVPHFGSDQASTYYYQCTSHPAQMYGLIKIKAITY